MISFQCLEDTKDPNSVEYEITVKTADKTGAGTGKIDFHLFLKQPIRLCVDLLFLQMQMFSLVYSVIRTNLKNIN